MIKLIKPKTIYNDVILYIHCIKSNDSVTLIRAVGNNEPVTFLEGSFVLGAIYPINLYSLEDSGGAEFVGYFKEKK